jgi:hypothetical protein
VLDKKILDSIVPGCKIKIAGIRTEYTIKKRKASNDGWELDDGWERDIHISEIISWPIPEKFEAKHIGHWIKLKTKEDYKGNQHSDYDGKYGVWHKIIDVNKGGGFDVNISGSAIYHCLIAEYRPFPPELNQSAQTITPISDEEFENIQSGDRIEIAPLEYIKSKCDTYGHYQRLKYVDSAGSDIDKILQVHYGKDTFVAACIAHNYKAIKLNTNAHQPNWYIHRDFVTKVIKKQIDDIVVKPYVEYEAETVPLPHYYNLGIKQEEKEMTVEQIKEIGDDDIRKQVAQEIKKEFDNAEAERGKKILRELVNEKSRLDFSIADLQKQLKVVEEKIAVFGYPPAT